MLLVLVACDGAAPMPTVVSSTTTTPNGQAADIAKTFVQALNQSDYSGAFALLDATAQQTLRDAESLRNQYLATSETLGVQQYSTQLRGVLQEADTASAALVTLWGDSAEQGWLITTTLPLTLSNNQWRVMWTRDVIAPGLSDGVLSFERVTVPRGAILAADGTALAEQSERSALGVQRGQIADAQQETAMLALLSRITGLDPADIKARYADQPADWFSPIAEVDNEVFQDNEAELERFSAIIARSSFVRHFPQPQLAPHLVGWMGPITAEALPAYRQRGYTGDERVGITGIEAAADEALAGSVGGRLLLTHGNGAIDIVAQRPFARGQDVTLTISPSLQSTVQQVLGQRNNAGAAVVLNVRDGSVLAMASYPTFDPSVFIDAGQTETRTQLLNAPDKPLLNRAAQSIYPPGSVFKMVVMAAAMHEAVAAPNDSFDDPCFWDGLGEPLRRYCWNRKGHGQLNLVQGLSASCNVVFYGLGKALDQKGQALLPEYARQFGFGRATGLELSGEADGLVPDPKWKMTTQGDGWATGDSVNFSIGQGFLLATPLQVAQMTAAIANGGTLHAPHLIAKIGDTPYAPKQAPSRLPVNEAELSAIQAGMRGVIEDERFGTAYFRFSTLDAYLLPDGRAVMGNTLTAEQRNSAIKITIAGKSGTAQTGNNIGQANPSANTNVESKPYAWFTAYVPADDPQIAITVMYEHIGEGSVYAAPIVRQIIEAYYSLPLSVVPTDTRLSD